MRPASILQVSRCLLLILVVVTPIFFIWSCSGDGIGLDLNGNPVGPGVHDTTVSFSRSIQPIFDQFCISCHLGAGAPLGLDLSLGKSYNNLVNIPSSEIPSILRIKPAHPDSSYLVWKIEADTSRIQGERMPFGGPYLDNQTIELIRKWIQQGALNN